LVLKSLTANNIFIINDLNIYLVGFLIFFLYFFGGMSIILIVEIIGNRHQIFIHDTFLDTALTIDGVF